jgi:hypothetical protein
MMSAIRKMTIISCIPKEPMPSPAFSTFDDHKYRGSSLN